jgi:hypothetical protein
MVRVVTHRATHSFDSGLEMKNPAEAGLGSRSDGARERAEALLLDHDVFTD